MRFATIYPPTQRNPLLISRACLRILVNLLIGPSNKSKNGRAPKGDGGLNSRACLRILSLWSSASGPYQSSPLKGPYQSSPLSGPCTRKRKPLRDLPSPIISLASASASALACSRCSPYLLAAHIYYNVPPTMLLLYMSLCIHSLSM